MCNPSDMSDVSLPQTGPNITRTSAATQLQLSRVANRTFRALEWHTSGSELHTAAHCNSDRPLAPNWNTCNKQRWVASQGGVWAGDGNRNFYEHRACNRVAQQPHQPQKTRIARCSHLYIVIFSRIQPYTATCSFMQPYTTIYSRIQPYSHIYSHIQPYTALHSHMQSYTTIYSHRKPYYTPYTSTCNHVHSYTTIYSHIQPSTATCNYIQPSTAIFNNVQPYAAIHSDMHRRASIHWHIQAYTGTYNQINSHIHVTQTHIFATRVAC